MKGIIFNLLEEMVEGEGGPAAWDTLLDDTGLDGGYSAIGDYPSAELQTLIAARARQLGRSDQAMLHAFGQVTLQNLAWRFPEFLVPHRRTRDFLLTLNDVIHPQVRKLHPAARPPEFDFTAIGEDELRIVYRSARRLCGMALGMIVGSAAQFGETVAIVHDECVLSGAPHCVIHCTFTSASHVVAAHG